MPGFLGLLAGGGRMPSPTSWKGFLFIAGTTVVAVLIVQPIIEKVFQSVTGRSAENVITMGKAA